MTSWHDGIAASRQSFTVKDWPKHRLGETSDELFGLAASSVMNGLEAFHGWMAFGKAGMSCPDTEHRLTARKHVLLAEADEST